MNGGKRHLLVDTQGLVIKAKRMSEKGRQAMIEGTKCLKGWVVYGREEVSQRHD